MRSLAKCWIARNRPLSARGHLYGIGFWLILTAFAAYRLLVGDEESAIWGIWSLVGLINVAVLGASYRNIRRRRREALRPSAGGNVGGPPEDEQRHP